MDDASDPPDGPRPAAAAEAEIKTATLRDYVFRLENEHDRLRESVSRLQAALRDAIRDLTRVRMRPVDAGESGVISAPDWTDRVRDWADLCDLDLAGMDPEAYARP